MIVEVAGMYAHINVPTTLHKLFKGTIKNIIPVILSFHLNQFNLALIKIIYPLFQYFLLLEFLFSSLNILVFVIAYNYTGVCV